MNIQLESASKHAIRSYENDQVSVGEVIYNQSVIISKDTIISPWPIHSIEAVNDLSLAPLLALNPEIILIGHEEPSRYLPIETRLYLSKLQIGIECMSVGSASRTFNLLLSEYRNVVIGMIFR